jgi:hypothetical protein
MAPKYEAQAGARCRKSKHVKSCTMKNLYIRSLSIAFIQVALWLGRDAKATTYNSVFPLAENPISEDGKWVNGLTVGLGWNNCKSTSGNKVVGATGAASLAYDDPTAILSGTWGANQTVSATVFITNRQVDFYGEVELRVRSSISANSCTGYEVNFSARDDSSAYCEIVRWNGAVKDFTYINRTSGSKCHINTGDVVKATIVGTTITAYINNVKILAGTDGTFASGNPGIGFYFTGKTGSIEDFGFTSFSASDEVDTPSSAMAVVFGPDSNGTFTLQFRGIPGTTWQLEDAENFDPPGWVPLGSGTANESGLFQFTDTPPLWHAPPILSCSFACRDSSGGARPTQE